MSDSFLARQHLIDPENCIRCETCETACKKKAISHDKRNYAIDAAVCDACGDCLPPCPTGAIESWRLVAAPYPIAEQLQWITLPEDTAPPGALARAEEAVPSALRLVAEAGRASRGVNLPPWSAAHPYVGLYSNALPAFATVTGNYRLTEPGAEVDIRHLVLDLGKTSLPLLEGQLVGVIPPGEDEDGHPHRLRLYFVASPRDGERPKHNNLALTVRRVTSDAEGRPLRGVASNYLCDLTRGDVVRLTGPYGSSFLMPNHPGANLLLVCVGTASAPMRAMTERRRRRLPLAEGGTITLFFGARRREDLPYFGPLEKLPKSLIDVHFAFSRSPDDPRYVQDRIREEHERVATLLSGDDTFVFVVGPKRMAESVRDAFADVCRWHGLDWTTVQDGLQAAGRFHVETY